MGVDTEYLKSRIEEVRELIGEAKRLVSKQYKELSMDEKYSLRYQIIALVESLGSMCLHIATEDLAKEPGSYSECFKLLENEGLAVYSEEVIKIIRLRNIIVHRYWTVDDAKIYSSIKEDFKEIEELLIKIGERYGIQT